MMTALVPAVVYGSQPGRQKYPVAIVIRGGLPAWCQHPGPWPPPVRPRAAGG